MRQMVIKQDGSQMQFEPTEFRVGRDIGICGRAIRIYDCDQYSREYFEVSYTFKLTNLLNLEHGMSSTTSSIQPGRRFC